MQFVAGLGSLTRFDPLLGLGSLTRFDPCWDSTRWRGSTRCWDWTRPRDSPPSRGCARATAARRPFSPSLRRSPRWANAGAAVKVMPANSSATVPVWKGAMGCLSTEGYSKLARRGAAGLLSILTVFERNYSPGTIQKGQVLTS